MPALKPISPFRKSRGLIAHKSGAGAERWAALLLLCKGYRILGRRMRTPYGEVDILAEKRGTMIAVEVKSRTHLAQSFEAISIHQRRRLIKAAQHLAIRFKMPFTAIRCDAFLFGAGGWPKHVKNAFEE